MNVKRAVNIASLMMLVWLAFYILAAFFVPHWADFIAVIGCTAPMLLVKQKYRGKTFGASQCNTVIYKKKEYALYFVLCITGCAIISALTFIILQALGITAAASSAGRSDFAYMLVFSCALPAFFEEWLLRGGVLGTLSKHGAAGVWLCGIFFALMHIDPTKWIYALFSGALITALVYLTECIYLGMLLHFCNNFVSLLLSYLPKGLAEYTVLAVIAVVFVVAFATLRQAKLGRDVWALLNSAKKEDFKDLLSPLFVLFLAAVLVIAFVGE